MSNIETRFAHTFADFASKSAGSENAKSRLIADIVSMHREHTDPDASPKLVTYMVDQKNDEGKIEQVEVSLTYDDMLKLAIGEDAAYKGKKATKWYDIVINSAPTGRNINHTLALRQEEAEKLRNNDNKDGLQRARYIELVGEDKAKDKKATIAGEIGMWSQKRNTLVTSLKRAFRVAAYVIEQNELTSVSDVYSTLYLDDRSATLKFIRATGDTDAEGNLLLTDGAPQTAVYDLPVTKCADKFGVHYAEWTKVPADSVSTDNGEVVEQSQPDVTSDEPEQAPSQGRDQVQGTDSVSIDAKPADFAKFVQSYVARHDEQIGDASGDVAKELMTALSALRAALGNPNEQVMDKAANA